MARCGEREQAGIRLVAAEWESGGLVNGEGKM